MAFTQPLLVGVSLVVGVCVGVLISQIVSRSSFMDYHRDVETAISNITVAQKRCNEETKVVLCVRNDLKMGKGKIGAQCGHAVLGLYMRIQRQGCPYLSQWISDGQRKVAVKVETEQEFDEVKKQAKVAGLMYYVVHDAGRTQIEAGSSTVLAIGPAPNSELNPITGNLKLL